MSRITEDARAAFDGCTNQKRIELATALCDAALSFAVLRAKTTDARLRKRCKAIATMLLDVSQGAATSEVTS